MSDALRAAIRDGDRQAATRAADSLLDSGGATPLAEAVLELLVGETAWLREGTLDLLRTIRPAPALIDRLIAELGSGTHPERRNAARSALAVLLAPGSVDPAAPLPRVADLLAGDPDVDVRILSAHALGESGNPRARQALQEALDDPDPNVVAAAAESLGSLNDPRAVGALIELVERGDFWTGNAAIVALGELGDRAAVPVLARLTTDPSLGTAAASTLGRIGDAAALESLRAAVRLGPELRQAVLRAAAEIVGREGEGVAPGWLRDELRADEDELMERFAHTPDLESARLLGLAGTRRAAAALIGGLGDGAHDSAVIGLELLPRSIRAECLLGRLHQADAESATDRALLLGLLPPLSDRPGIESVAAFLNDAGVEVRAAAAEALGRSDETLVIALLEELRKDPMARLGVALAYGRMGSTRCTPLLALLSDPDASVRAAAAEGTGRCGLGSVAQLRDALRRETDPAAQRAMVRALGLEGGEEAVAELERMLASEDPPLRFEAVRALGHTDSEAAFPLLVAALSDADAGIRTAALSALGELGDARAKEPISRHIDDPDRDHRRVAAVAFDRVFGIESVAGFETALNDPDREVRLLAVTALGKLRLPDTASLLERVAEEDRDPLVRHTAAAVAAGLQGAGGEAP